jgi:heme-degrading monooxygenase HmoA
MILEVASLTVRPGEQGAFERAFAKAERLLPEAAGYLSHELRCSIENEHRYVLLVEWRRLEDHTLGFRKSGAFERLRVLLQGYLQTTPDVEHFRAVVSHNAAAPPLAD